VDRERILSLLDLLRSSGAAELAVREGDCYVRLRRARAVAAPVASSPGAAEAAPGLAVGPGAPAAPASAEPTVIVAARLVGFFHAGQGPDSEPLVQVGDRVERGQTIGTIESLRQVTAVTAPVAGTVVEIVASEHQAVQYGQALIILRPEPEAQE
jgi:acetyl-CoA carboxylase biotin carboxyl carrier protein